MRRKKYKYESWLEEELAKHLIEFDRINKIIFGSGMRAAQLESIKRISERSGELSTDPLLRRSYISTIHVHLHFFNTEISPIYRNIFLNLSFHLLSDSDLSDFETAQLDGLNLKLLLRKYLLHLNCLVFNCRRSFKKWTLDSIINWSFFIRFRQFNVWNWLPWMEWPRKCSSQHHS